MIFVRGARQLVTLRGPAPPRRGMQLQDLGVIPDGALLIDGEQIREVGTTRRIENLAATRSASVIDATGKVVVPGFVDSHTGRIQTSLPQLAPAGSPLGVSAPGPPPLPSTLRAGSPKALRQRLRDWAQCLAAHGTTTLEVRSGSGLPLASNIPALRAARSLDGEPLEVSAAFVAGLGRARGKSAPSAADVEQLTELLLPALRRRRLASVCGGQCGPAAFDVDQARLILERARELRLGLRVQRDRRARSGAVRLAVDSGAWSVEGLERISDEEIDLLGGSPTIAPLLPGVGYAEGGERYEPARRLVDRGAAIALAAATIQDAAALGCAARLGSFEPGKQADLAVLDVRD